MKNVHGKRVHHVAEVFIFANGNCAVMDEYGEQIPKLQGPWLEVWKRVLKRCDAMTAFWDERRL